MSIYFFDVVVFGLSATVFDSDSTLQDLQGSSPFFFASDNSIPFLPVFVLLVVLQIKIRQKLLGLNYF